MARPGHWVKQPAMPERHPVGADPPALPSGPDTTPTRAVTPSRTQGQCYMHLRRSADRFSSTATPVISRGLNAARAWCSPVWLSAGWLSAGWVSLVWVSLVWVSGAGVSSAWATPASSAATGTGSSPLVATRASRPPTIDGRLGDACWATTLRVDDFTEPETATPPAQAMRAWISYDETALYLALACAEADTSRIRARTVLVEGDLGVWQDDCVEVWIRSGRDGARFHQFIVNARGLTETHYGPPGLPGSEHTYNLQAATRIEDGATWAGRWTCEMAIPFADLDLPGAPTSGEIVEIKFGREDYASGGSGGARLASWPPNTPYGRAGYGVVHLGRSNLLTDPSFGRALGGSGRWRVTKPADVMRGDGAASLSVQGGGRVTQVVTLAPGSLYRLTCEVMGSGPGALRVSALDTADGAETHETTFLATDTWTPHRLSVPVGGGGRYRVALTSSGMDKGISFRYPRVTPDPSRPVAGRAIPLPAGGDSPFVIRQVGIADSRAVRGFLHPPIDGTLESGGWDGRFWEYPSPGPGGGVYYEHPYRNDGLHIALEDGAGVNAIQVRGGAKARVVADVGRFDDPASGRPVHTFPGRASASLAWFDEPVAAGVISFFDVGDGHISDLGLFRTGGPVTGMGRASAYPLVPEADPSPAGPQFHERFDAPEPKVYGASTAGDSSAAFIYLEPGEPIHILAGPWDETTAIAGAGLRATLGGGPRDHLTLQIQDPVFPRTAVSTVTVTPPSGDRLNLALDHPDLVLPAGTPLWITLTAADYLELNDLQLVLHQVPVETARDEALGRALLKTKGFFAVLSEPRPWTGLRTDTDVTEFLSGKGALATQLLELRDGIDYCYWLAPDHGVVRQYYQWFYRGKLRPELPEAVLPEVPGAPEWAVAARTAWLAARSVPDWWLTHRDTPGGELGSGIGDDTDMYQNYIDFPFLEGGGLEGDGLGDDNVAARLLDGAARLAELIDEHRLEQGLNRMVTDPLHAYEEGANHVALMTRWHYGDPVYFERCMENARSTWALTAVNGAGHRHFKSQMQGAADLRFDRPTDIDGAQHPLMLHGVCEVVWYNRNPLALQLLREWGDAWLDHQKPGEYATDVEVATDRVVGSEQAPWRGGYDSQGGVFKFLYEATGDARYLRPVREFYQSGHHSGALDRRATDLYNLAAFDDQPDVYAAMAPHAPALQWALTGDKQPFIAQLKAAAAEIQTFGHMYTAAEVFTDRIFLAVATRAPTLAYTGGFGTRNKLYRSHGASWEGFGTQFAALVRAARPDRFEALVYSFADTAMQGHLRLWNATHGRYALTSGIDTDGDDRPDANLARQHLEVVRGEPVAIELPPGQTTALELVREEELDPLRDRADLALSAREISVRGNAVEGVAHNIGSAAAAAVIALVDEGGRERARQNIGSLEAPLDLYPRRRAFVFEGVAGIAAGWRVVADPDGQVDEITECNNSVELGGIVD